MAREHSLDPDTESRETGSSDESTSPEEDDGEKPESWRSKVEGEGISEYERLRLNRIADNRARMEALGLKKMAYSFIGSIQNQYMRRKCTDAKRKCNANKDDDDYKPNDDDVDEDSEYDDATEEDDNGDEDCLGKQFPSNTHKNKGKGSQHKKKVHVGSRRRSSDFVDEEDENELMQAIALSLRESAGDAAIKKDGAGKKKNNKMKSFSSRIKMTEDEVVLRFFEFDEAGRGAISVRDVDRVSSAHDFTWTGEELSDMITCFDSDHDGKLSLSEFRKIAARCNIFQESCE